MRNRKGFTAIEMALVTTIVGLMAAVALPRFANMRESGSMNAAKRHLITQLGAARAASVQRGRAVVFHTDGAEIWLTTEVGGKETDVGPRSKVHDEYEVKIEASDADISFDARGFATNLPATGGKFVLYRGDTRDAICVTRFGTVLPECGL